MRLICPNCGAQYEVPDDVIPEGGRDVQCSNCGQTWQARRGGDPVAVVAEPDPDRDGQDDATSIQPPVGDPTQETAAEPHAAPDVEIDDDEAEDRTPGEGDIDEDQPAAPEPRKAQQRRGVDPAVTRILREEAEREARVRAEAARQATRQSTDETFGNQGDLDLDPRSDPEPAPDPDDAPQQARADSATQRGEETRRRIARLKGEPAPRTSATVTGATRKELLPDIEEINSSLRPNVREDADDAVRDTATERRSRSGFRLGFLLVVFIALALTGLYLLADQIGTLVPALAPALADYSTAVDAGRLWLDLKLQELLVQAEAE